MFGAQDRQSLVWLVGRGAGQAAAPRGGLVGFGLPGAAAGFGTATLALHPRLGQLDRVDPGRRLGRGGWIAGADPVQVLLGVGPLGGGAGLPFGPLARGPRGGGADPLAAGDRVAQVFGQFVAATVRAEQVVVGGVGGLGLGQSLSSLLCVGCSLLMLVGVQSWACSAR